MERKTTMRAGKFMLGLGIALGAGAVLGILLAPDKGSVTRKKLSRQGSRVVGATNSAVQEYNDKLIQGIEGAREIAGKFTEKVKQAAETLSGS
jgi:gas vesicle protein